MKKKLMLTGAMGFLGSHFLNRIDTHDYQPYYFSLHADSKKNISVMDLTAFSDVQKIVSDTKPDIIVHLGGLVDLTRDFGVAKKCIDTNLVGTLNLLEATRSHVPKLFIYVSTEEIYGDAPVPYKEDSLPAPPSPYAVTKVAAEYLCNLYGKYLGFPVVILRVGTMYGPKDSEKRFLPTVISQALRNKDILLNSGKKLRDYVFVDDVVDALLACLKLSGSKKSEIVNIGGGKSYTLKWAVEKIVQLCQSTSSIKYGAFPDRSLEADIWNMDLRKAKQMLGWSPKTSLGDGLSKTIEYYRNK